MDGHREMNNWPFKNINGARVQPVLSQPCEFAAQEREDKFARSFRSLPSLPSQVGHHQVVQSEVSSYMPCGQDMPDEGTKIPMFELITYILSMIELRLKQRVFRYSIQVFEPLSRQTNANLILGCRTVWIAGLRPRSGLAAMPSLMRTKCMHMGLTSGSARHIFKQISTIHWNRALVLANSCCTLKEGPHRFTLSVCPPKYSETVTIWRFRDAHQERSTDPPIPIVCITTYCQCQIY